MDYSVPLLSELVLVSSDIKRELQQSAGLSIEQYQVLTVLEIVQDTVTPGLIARSLALPASSVATALKKLRAIDAIRQATPSDDKRMELISLSPAGAALLARVDSALESVCARIWAPLTHGQRDITQWGSMSAMSGAGRIRVKEGTVNVESAYCNSVIVSLRTCRRTLHKHSLSVNEYRLLKTAAEQAGTQGIRATDIGMELVMDSSLVAQTLGRLENRVLIQRQAGEDDARTRLVRITEAGTCALEPAKRDILRTMRRDITPMSRVTADRFGQIAVKIVASYRDSKALR